MRQREKGMIFTQVITVYFLSEVSQRGKSFRAGVFSTRLHRSCTAAHDADYCCSVELQCLCIAAPIDCAKVLATMLLLSSQAFRFSKCLATTGRIENSNGSENELTNVEARYRGPQGNARQHVRANNADCYHYHHQPYQQCDVQAAAGPSTNYASNCRIAGFSSVEAPTRVPPIPCVSSMRPAPMPSMQLVQPPTPMPVATYVTSVPAPPCPPIATPVQMTQTSAQPHQLWTAPTAATPRYTSTVVPAFPTFPWTPNRPNNGACCLNDGQGHALSTASPCMPYLSPQPALPSDGPPTLPTSIWSTVEGTGHTFSESVPQMQSGHSSTMVQNFSSSPPQPSAQTSRLSSSQAAVVGQHQQQHYCYSQLHQAVPCMAVGDMFSQQGQLSPRQGGAQLELETEGSVGVRRGAESIAQSSSRRQRTVYTPEQLRALEELFAVNKYPDLVAREQLAARLELAESRVQVWFKNRRAKLRNVQRQS
ncbi:hypothetical protein TcWFU_010049 [Taenia crassiceps]|uniref:Homeobox domain-containing protein n=1 Tax=Taenia crassiceps TaxID=6207 RepID=A0ABR4QBL9_9CEST